MRHACRRFRISRAPFAPLWAAGLIRRQPGPAGFLLMQCVCGAAGAGGWVRAAASPSVLTDKLLQEKNQSL